MSEPALSPSARLVRAGDPDRFLAAMTAPAEGRERLMALYAFNLELARVPAAISEPMLGEIRLAWWREVVAAAFTGGAVRAHEVVVPLTDTIRAAGLPRGPLDAMIDARGFDILDAPHRDMAACLAYLAATAGGLMRLGAQALAGALPDPADKALGDLGLAHGIANLLAATPALIARGRRPVPFIERPGDRNALAEGRCPEGFRAAVADLAGQGLAAHHRARLSRRAVPPAAVPAARAAWRVLPVLRALARKPEDIFALRRESEFRRRFSLLARALGGRW